MADDVCMAVNQESNLDLGTLLRAWRARVQPGDVGFRSGRDARRTPGLRREEVAWLAGVSPDYVKRLEQGRAHPSLGVLRAVARVLQLTETELELVCRLAGHAAEAEGMVPQRVAPSVQRMLARMPDVPIAVFDATWTLLTHNEVWSALMGGSRGEFGGDDRWSTNLVWRCFHDEDGRVRHPFPHKHRASLVADLRDVASRYPADRDLAGMVAALRRTSEEFARMWDEGIVAHYSSDVKTVDHPGVGAIELDCDVMSVHGADVRVIVFTAARGSVAAGQLALLTVIGLEDMDPADRP